MLDLIAEHLATEIEKLRPVERTILDDRMLINHRRTLEDIGQEYGLTRERVRQKQSDLARKIASCIGPTGRKAASQIAEDLDLIDTYDKFERSVRRAVPHAQERIRRVLMLVLIDVADFKLIDGKLISNRAFSYVKRLKKLAQVIADSCGLFDREELLDAFGEQDIRHHFIWFQQECGFHEMFGLLALRDTRKAKLKAALISLDRPATRPELADMCGLTNKIASAALSSIPEIVRISRTQWALKDWGLREYKGIVEEIVDYITNEGGIASVDPLIEDIAQRFEVKKWSVRAYMQTPKFHMVDGRIRLAGLVSPPIRPLSDVVHGYDDKGRAYWTFPVLERYFRGYSVVGVPFEVAAFLGCPPDDATTLQIDNLPNCRALTIQWYLSSTTKVSIGFVRDALERLNVNTGHSVRLTLVQQGVVELNWHPSPTSSESNASEARTSVSS
ncbi:MAG: hypothetical protein OXG25_08795 [Gammaproteobacteria bacterium]|nr:hypothetical protein [Gammaproteobacteria bacterium]